GHVQRQLVQGGAVGGLVRRDLRDLREGVEGQPLLGHPVVPLHHPLDRLPTGEVAEVAGVGVRGITGQVVQGVQPLDVGLSAGQDGRGCAVSGQCVQVLGQGGGALQLWPDQRRGARLVGDPAAQILQRGIDRPVLRSQGGERRDRKPARNQGGDEGGGVREGWGHQGGLLQLCRGRGARGGG